MGGGAALKFAHAELSAQAPNLTRARAVIAEWVKYYNTERLHAGLGYLTSADFYCGNSEQRNTERQVKLEQAKGQRRRIDERLKRAA